MPKTYIPKILKTAALTPYTVEIEWDNGTKARIDLGEWLNKSKWFKPILESTKVWKSLHIEQWGWIIAWDDCEMEIPSSTLWRLYLEQTKQAMRKDDFESWMSRHGFGLDQAAKELGISRRMAAYYKSGERIIPKTVMLACVGVDCIKQQ